MVDGTSAPIGRQCDQPDRDHRQGDPIAGGKCRGEHRCDALSADDALLTNTDVVSGAAGATLPADKMALNAARSATGNSVTLLIGPGTDAITVGANQVPTANTLELSNTELDTISATASVFVETTTQTGGIIVGRDHVVAQGTKNLQFITSGKTPKPGAQPKPGGAKLSLDTAGRLAGTGGIGAHHAQRGLR